MEGKALCNLVLRISDAKKVCGLVTFIYMQKISAPYLLREDERGRALSAWSAETAWEGAPDAPPGS